MIERFLDALAAAKLDLSAEEVADVLWLASHMRFAATLGEMPPGMTKLPTEPRGATEPTEEEREAKVGQERPAGGARPTEVHLPLSQGTAAGGHGRRGRAVQSPGAPALPGSLGIARSLRPFKRRVPSRRHNLLDEEATVARIAGGGPKVPVLKPEPERWLELALVVDQSPSMVLWRQTLAELLRLLECHGAFRDVRVWSLTTDSDRVLLQSGSGTGARPGSRSPRELVDPSGRRLIVVVSDCVSETWHRGEMTTQALSIWARSGPLVLLQVLPERLWHRTGLAIASDARLAGSLPGQRSQRLRVRGRRDQWRPVNQSEVALPAVTLEPRALAAWARMVAGFGGAWVPGKLLNFATVAIDDSEAGAPEPSAEDISTAAQRVRRFRANASPTARKLASYLAAVPLSLPVMRLVQAVMLPESRQVHLAEVFLGGILKQVTSDVDVTPEEVQYDFEDGVRDLLLNEVRRSETLQVLEEVSAWLERQQGVKRGFRVLIEDPTSTEEITLVDGSLPIASVTTGVLRRLGLQQYQQAAPVLEMAASAGSMGEAPQPTVEASSPSPAPSPAVPLAEPERSSLSDLRAEAGGEELSDEANSRKSQGDTYLREGRLDEAEGAYRSALAIYQQIEDLAGEVEVRRSLGSLYIRIGRLREAEEAYLGALEIFERIGSPLGKASMLRMLGDLFIRTDRLREAERVYHAALPIYQQGEDRPGEANTQQSLGHLYARVYRLGEAEASYQSALPIYQEIEDRLGEADTRRALGDLYVGTARVSEAEAAYQSAMPIYQQIEDRLGEAGTRRALGDLYVSTARVSEAEAAYQSAMPIYQQIEDRLGEADTRRALGDLYVSTARVSEAEAAYQSALPIYQEIEDRLGEADTRRAFGDLYVSTARVSEAEAAYQSALPIYQQIEDRLGEADARRALGDLYILTDRLREAEDTYQNALRIYQQLVYRSREANVLQALGDLYVLTDRLREAEDTYQGALRIYQQLGDRLGEANTRRAQGKLYVRAKRLQEAEAVSQSPSPLYQQVDDRFGANLSKLKVFVSYSHKDQEAFEQLQRFLRPLEREGLVTAWADNRLARGDDWRNRIDRELAEATVAVLLISQNFLSSRFISTEEIPRILALEAVDQLTIVPVFLGPSLVEKIEFPNPRDKGRSTIQLSKFQGYGSPAKPLSSLRRAERERVFADLLRHLQSLVGGVQKASARQEPVRLGIQSMVGWGPDMTARNDVVLDLVAFFDGRFIRKIEFWQKNIFPELRSFLVKNIDPRRPVQLEIAAHSSIAFAAGWLLEAKSGLDVRVIQRVATEGEVAWHPSDGLFEQGPLWLDRPDLRLSKGAQDVAVAISASQPGVAEEVEAFIRRHSLPVERIIDATIAPAPGPRSVRGGAHALRLAQELVSRLRRRAPHERKGALHFFCAAPNALLVYLGQTTRSLGRIVTYEYAFESQGSYGRYQRAIELPQSSPDKFLDPWG